MHIESMSENDYHSILTLGCNFNHHSSTFPDVLTRSLDPSFVGILPLATLFAHLHISLFPILFVVRIYTVVFYKFAEYPSYSISQSTPTRCDLFPSIPSFALRSFPYSSFTSRLIFLNIKCPSPRNTQPYSVSFLSSLHINEP
jgi:hypothetical protein